MPLLGLQATSEHGRAMLAQGYFEVGCPEHGFSYLPPTERPPICPHCKATGGPPLEQVRERITKAITELDDVGRLRKLASFDLETWGVDLSLYPTPPIVCASIQIDGELPYLVKGGDAAVVEFCKLLKRGCEVGGANFTFDLGCLVAHEPALLPKVYKALDEGRLHDVQLLERLHDNARGCLEKDVLTGAPFHYSLADLEKRHFGRDRSAEKENGWRMRYAELDAVPLVAWPAEARNYPLDDAKGTLDLLKGQLAEGRQNVQCEAQEMRAAWAMRLQSIRGIRTDAAAVKAFVEEVEAEHVRSRRQFLEVGFIAKRKPRGGKDPEVPEGVDHVQKRDDGPQGIWIEQPYVYVAKKAPLQERVTAAYGGNPPLTEKGGVSCDRDTLLDSGDELLEDYGHSTENEKLRTTYADVLRQGAEAPIHVSYNSLLTSGRCSCRKPNLQNLPRGGKVRECFCPRQGFLFLSTDYAALEMVTLAQVCFTLFGTSAMRDSINADEDQHVRLAARVMGIDYAEGMRLKAAGDTTLKRIRQAMKEVNFGIPGGMGPPKLVLRARHNKIRLCVSAGEAELCGSSGKTSTYRGRQITPTCVDCLRLAVKYRDLFFEEWPEVKRYHELTAQASESGEPLESMSAGGMLRLEKEFGAASNHFFQNLAAVGAKDALQAVTRAYLDPTVKSSLYGKGATVLFVHDEIISEVYEKEAHECAMEQSRLMVEVMQRHVPDVAVKCPPALARRWFKGMEAVYDKAGRLIPWEPSAP